jgi:hypothetical protein
LSDKESYKSLFVKLGIGTTLNCKAEGCMKIEIISHSTGDQIPILLSRDGLPLVLPNEFILSRRNLSTNTLVRNLRELSVLYRWLDKSSCDLSAKLLANTSFKEAELKGGLVEALRIDQANGRIRAVAPNTFNQRLTIITLMGFVMIMKPMLC